MKYTEIAVSTTTEASDIVADILTELTGEGVAIYDKQDFLNADWDYCDEQILNSLTDEVVVKGFAKQEIADNVLSALHGRLEGLEKQGDFGRLAIVQKNIDDGEWLVYRKKFFKPVKVGKFVICPHDLDYFSDGETVVKLDIGIAFGTGEHETTQMCLDLGQSVETRGKRIADLGCGSGILGISFLKDGAQSCFFVDYDEQAVEATKRNLLLNGLDNAAVEQGTLDKFSGDYDVVFANLTADIIEKFIDDILKFCKKGGHIVFSGILLERESDILSLCGDKKLDVVKMKRRGEWTAMVVKNG